MSERLVRPRRTGVASLAAVVLTSAVSLAGVVSLTGAAHADVPDFTPAAPGTVFVSDIWQGQVLAVDPDGDKSVYVTGVQPYGLAVDQTGDLFIAQENNDVVEIAPDGTRTDLTVNSVSAALQVAVDDAGNLYVADTGNQQVVKRTPDGTETQVPFTGLSYPEGVTVDSTGAVYVSDEGSGRIVKLDAEGTQTDFATGLSCPLGLTSDHDDNVYVANECAGNVLRYAPDGTPTDVGFQNTRDPYAVAVDATGTVLAAGEDNSFFGPGGGGATVWQKNLEGHESQLTTIYSPYAYGIAVSQPRAPQSISFTSDPGSTPTVGDRYDVTATGGGSGKPVTFSVDPDSAGVCSVVSHLDSSGTVWLVGPGNCTIDAAQAQTRGYLAGSQQQSFAVKADGALAFTSSPSAARMGDTYQAATSSDSSGAVTFSSASPRSCSVSDAGLVTFLHATSCTVVASQAGTDDYLEGTATQTIRTRRAIQTVVFTSDAPHKPRAGTTYDATASGRPTGRRVRLTGAGACSVGRHGVVHFNHRGTCTVFARQAGTADYKPGTAKQLIVVRPRSSGRGLGTPLLG
ncbi:MAG: hypothetical protein WB797_08030 [Nocardioides sp.]